MAEKTKAVVLKETVEYRVNQSMVLLQRLGVSEQEMIRITLNAFMVGPDISDCTPESIDAALLKAIEMGLMPDTREAVIIPYKRKATLVPMVEGRLKMARKATPGLVVRARCVYEGDEWEYREGLDPRLEHVPTSLDKRDEKLIAGYAVSTWPADPRMPSSQLVSEHVVMLRPDIDRARAWGADDGPWVTHYPEMVETACCQAAAEAAAEARRAVRAARRARRRLGARACAFPTTLARRQCRRPVAIRTPRRPLSRKPQHLRRPRRRRPKTTARRLSNRRSDGRIRGRGDNQDGLEAARAAAGARADRGRQRPSAPDPRDGTVRASGR